MTGLVAVLIGALLCFAGVASLHLGVLLSGFGACWIVADAVGASPSTSLIIGIAGAVVAWILVSLVFRVALFFVGGVAGALIGAKLYSLLQSDRNILVALIFAAALAIVCGWLANRWRVRVLLWLTALAGAGLVLHGLGRAFDSLNALRNPSTGGQQVITSVVWVGLALLGVVSQRKVSARALKRDRAHG